MDTVLQFRNAEKCDVSLILNFIKELAEYEKLLNEVVATEETLLEWIFEKQKAEVMFLMVDGKEIGFILFFQNFSTFMGRGGLYLEDLYIKPEYRGKGYGKTAMKKLAKIAVERGCARFEWICLDWNKSSIDFYKSLNAEEMSDWTIHRVSGDNLKKLAE